MLPATGARAYVCRDIIDAPIAAAGEHVYVTWASDKSGNWEVLFRASHNNGQTFGDKINLSESPDAVSTQPDISAEGNEVFISFLDARSGNLATYVRTSEDHGATFTPITQIPGTGDEAQPPAALDLPTHHPPDESAENTKIAVSGSNLYVVSWDRTSGNWEVFLAASNDGGQTFNQTINLSETPEARSDRALITVEGPNVYVSWWETTADGSSEPVLRVSNDGGRSFGPTLHLAADGPLSASGGEQDQPPRGSG